jgi:hypothetical protein
MRLQGRCDFISRLQRVINGPIPRGVINHTLSIAHRLASAVT